MSENTKVARRLWEEVIPNVDLDVVAAIVAADAVDHTIRPGERQGADGVRDTMRFLAAAFAEQRFDVRQTIEEDDRVVVHATHSGRHIGPIIGIAPTNREFSYDHIHILRFANGKVVEHWGVHDFLTFMQQVGASPAQRQPASA